MNKEEKCKECIHVFMKADRLRRKYIEKRIGSLAIHHSQHRVLMYISRCEKTPNQKEIAEKFDISPAAVAVTIKKLENNGYISRSVALQDSRYNNIKITDKGKDIIKQSSAVFKEIDEKTFIDFSDAEIDELIRLLNKINRAITE